MQCGGATGLQSRRLGVLWCPPKVLPPILLPAPRRLTRCPEGHGKCWDAGGSRSGRTDKHRMIESPPRHTKSDSCP